MKENTRNRGFASMDAEKQREIARKGGKAAHQRGTAHEFTPDEAREAGRRGGERVSHDRTHMANIGRMGGKSSAARRRGHGPEEVQPGQAPEQQRPGPEQPMGQIPGQQAGPEESPQATPPAGQAIPEPHHPEEQPSRGPGQPA